MPENLSGYKLLARKVLNAAGKKHVILTERLVKSIGCAIGNITSKAKIAKRAGGKSFKKLLEKWETDPYHLKIYYSEIQITMISDENRKLKRFKESAMAEVHTLKKSRNFYLSKWRKVCKQVTKVPKKTIQLL